MGIIAIKLENNEWYLTEIGERLYLDRSGYYVVEKVGLHPILGSASYITHVWSDEDIKEVLVQI